MTGACTKRSHQPGWLKSAGALCGVIALVSNSHSPMGRARPGIGAGKNPGPGRALPRAGSRDHRKMGSRASQKGSRYVLAGTAARLHTRRELAADKLRIEAQLGAGRRDCSFRLKPQLSGPDATASRAGRPVRATAPARPSHAVPPPPAKASDSRLDGPDTPDHGPCRHATG